MLDYCYLNEIGLPESIEEIARLIRMRTHCDCIANVLREYFTASKTGFINQRCEIELHEYKSKSDKAKESAKEKWRKHREKEDANAVRTLCDGNAKHKTLNTKQETLNTKQINTNIASSSTELSTEINHEKFITLPTNKKGELFRVYESDAKLWIETYQAVNIGQELKNINAWLDANPNKRKTARGMKSFINRWLSKAQDNPRQYASNKRDTLMDFLRDEDFDWSKDDE